MLKPIPFIDLASQRDRLRSGIDRRIAAIFDSCAFIMGPDVRELEERLCSFSGVAHTLSCSSGTDALALPLMAWGIGPGDAVFVPSFTFAATAEVVAWLGATPVFIDVHEDTFNMDPASLQAAIGEVEREGKLRPRAVIAVDLFGQIADYPAIKPICEKHHLKLISDAAQGFGSTLDGKMANAWADVVTTSFYPAKPLGCYGDGGAIQTDDAELAKVMESLRVHGGGTDRYDNVRIGMNGRMDTIQAAVLLEKLTVFPEEIELRQAVADRYASGLGDVVKTQRVIGGAQSTWAQYTVTLSSQRDAFMTAMKGKGVPTVIYYGKPLHRQTAYSAFPRSGGTLPVCDRLSEIVVSLPMYPYLDNETQDYIIQSVRQSLDEIHARA
ncbi:DegT/DnrJ/EryC1/StrS family aminotransferase [Consotaella salsifontis]|uniref:dTDP-4-amino-4,6-dideoxygalactose transaminase n=1 Tax=Consotaella salsifontis TaxID=1365950 RepID=A0A1T4T3D7_9HYPH|nr:DegT/DnrJ/EryC1/StrS aminotransferase family protein [Consotaella salsifontis]SKA34916.1 dTDP-4-amino-4,6-dideoxygalactose transaminase [Consotaella salsifontis]